MYMHKARDLVPYMGAQTNKYNYIAHIFHNGAGARVLKSTIEPGAE